MLVAINISANKFFQYLFMRLFIYASVKIYIYSTKEQVLNCIKTMNHNSSKVKLYLLDCQLDGIWSVSYGWPTSCQNNIHSLSIQY